MSERMRLSPRLLATVSAEAEASGTTVSTAVRGFLERWTARQVGQPPAPTDYQQSGRHYPSPDGRKLADYEGAFGAV